MSVEHYAFMRGAVLLKLRSAQSGSYQYWVQNVYCIPAWLLLDNLHLLTREAAAQHPAGARCPLTPRRASKNQRCWRRRCQLRACLNYIGGWHRRLMNIHTPDWIRCCCAVFHCRGLSAECGSHSVHWVVVVASSITTHRNE